MLVKINTAALNGLTAMPVVTEINVGRGMEFFMVGLPDNAVRESRLRVNGALANSGYHLPQRSVTINFAPADVRKTGPVYDLPLLLAVLQNEPDSHKT